ncbi:MAG TPA: acetate--CoA ligase family protein [Longimicrobiales bacterium]|nr:acetate--CoA ligase family protein [Longimicrobiales bacterium]
MAPGLDAVFRPTSVAVVGASADPAKRGFQILRALAESGFAGDVHPVNPRGGEILGRTCFPTLDAIPETPELAVVCTPASTVPDVIAACGRAGVRAAVVLAVGFGESGDEGAALQARVAEAGRHHGVRIVGPNTSGLLNLPLGLNLIGARGVRSGTLSLLVQSGNMALALMKEVTERSGEGIAMCAGLGNEIDVGFGESLEWLGRDPGTRAVLCYAEGIRDTRRFLSAAARVAPTTPVVLLKAGRSKAGAEAARSHTGSVAGPHDRLAAGLAQAGVVEVRRTDELLHVGETLAWQPVPPAGSGIAILSDGGGQGTLAADALSDMGAEPVELAPATREALRSLLGPAAGVANPVDLAGAADADPGMFARALEVLAADPGVGTVLVVGLFGGYGVRFDERLTPPEVSAADAMAVGMRSVGKALVMHSMYAPQATEPIRRLQGAHVPVVASLEVACRCAVEASARGRRAARPSWSPDALPTPAPDPGAAQALARATVEGREALTETEAGLVLAGAGLPASPATVCRTAEEAVAAAAAVDGPVALKVHDARIVHKTDVGGVVLGVEGAAGVRGAFEAIRGRVARRLGADPEGILVTAMHARPVAEVLVGAVRDPRLGPVLTLGSGGVLVEVIREVAHRLLPVTAGDVEEMLDELRLGEILAGARGAPADHHGVVAAALSLSRALLDHPGISEIEVNPLFVYADRVVPVDARVLLGAVELPGR